MTAAPVALRLASLNVNGRRAAVRALPRLLQPLGVDCVALQECRAGDAADLAHALGPEWRMVYAPADYLGTALLTRWPLDGGRNLPDVKWPSPPNAGAAGAAPNAARLALAVRDRAGHWEEVRSAALCRVATRCGPVTVVGLHLDHLSEDLRFQQCQRIGDALAELNVGDEPHCLIGDFNALHRADYCPAGWRRLCEARDRYGLEEAHSTVMDALLAEGLYTDAAAACRAAGAPPRCPPYCPACAEAGTPSAAASTVGCPTCVPPTTPHRTRVDYLLASPPLRFTEYGMVDTMGTDVSDHQLIYADVCWDRPDDRRNVG
eukprot:EG_transcript_14286